MAASEYVRDVMRRQVRALDNQQVLVELRADFDHRAEVSNESAQLAGEFDPIFREVGSRAPSPLRGESPRAYQLRLIPELVRVTEEIRPDNARHRNVSLRALQQLPPEPIEQIWGEAATDAREAVVQWAPEGQLRPRQVERGGLPATEFASDPRVWFSHFTAPARAVRKFMNGAGTEVEATRIALR